MTGEYFLLPTLRNGAAVRRLASIRGRVAGQLFGQLLHQCDSIQHQLCHVNLLGPNPDHRRDNFLTRAGNALAQLPGFARTVLNIPLNHYTKTSSLPIVVVISR